MKCPGPGCVYDWSHDFWPPAPMRTKVACRHSVVSLWWRPPRWQCRSYCYYWRLHVSDPNPTQEKYNAAIRLLNAARNQTHATALRTTKSLGARRTLLATVPYWDPVVNQPPDAMHLIIEGMLLTALLTWLQIWFIVSHGSHGSLLIFCLFFFVIHCLRK
jgi:hypothetical protein